jgi:uracil-DNA glycosylase family 4
MHYPDYVKERLAHGSLCHVCPLNGQRKVGHDGPEDAEHIIIAEAPGADEESYKLTQGLRYGRPLVGKTGYFFKLRHLAPLGLVSLLPGRTPEYPRIGALKVHLMNVIMCRPPNNKIDSKEGKAAVKCCANSARWFINERLKANPNISLHPLGGTALGLLRGEKTSIEPYRGRPTGPHDNFRLDLEPENDIYKAVLRGKKPKEEWFPWFEKAMKKILTWQRAGLRKAERKRLRELWESEEEKVFGPKSPR